MDISSRPVRTQWFYSLLNHIDQLFIQDYLDYSIQFFTFLSYHSMICTVFSTLMVFVNAASNPCHGSSLLSFETSDILSILLSVGGFFGSWSVLSVLNSWKHFETKKRNQFIYFPFLVTTIAGTFLAFCLFMFIISESNFLNLWPLTLDKYMLQNIRYYGRHQMLSCFPNYQLVQLGVLSFSYLVAGGISIIRFLCHDSLWQLIQPTKESPSQAINRSADEFIQNNGYYPPEGAPVSNPNAATSPPPYPTNRQGDQNGTVSAMVHSASADIPIQQFATENKSIQQSCQNIDETQNATLANGQSKSRNEPSAPTNSPSRPHLLWIDELKQYLAKSGDTNCQIPDAGAIDLPVAAHSCLVEKLEASQHVSPSSSPFSKRKIQEKLQKVCEVHISNQRSNLGSRLEQRRGAVSGPSGSALLESQVNGGQEVEGFFETAELRNLHEFSSLKKEFSFRKPKPRRSSSSAEIASGDAPSLTSGYELGSALGLTSAEDQLKYQRTQQNASVSQGFSQVGGDIRVSGGLSSDGEEVPARSSFSHFGDAHQQSTGGISSDSESESQTSHNTTYTIQANGSTSSGEFRSYSFTSSRDSQGSICKPKNANQFASTDGSATSVRGGTEEGSQKRSSEFDTNLTSVAVPRDPENQMFQYCSKSKSSEGQIPLKSNQSCGELVMQIDSDNQKAKYSEDFGTFITSTPGFVDRGENHPGEVHLELGHSSLAFISPVVSDDGDKPVQKNCRLRHADSSPAVYPEHPSQIASAVRCGEAGGNEFQPQSTSSTEPLFSSSPNLVSHGKSDKKSLGRRDSRTSAIDLDKIDESSTEGSDDSGCQNRSRLSSESTDSGLFLDNLFSVVNSH